jgi:hypothetical protein
MRTASCTQARPGLELGVRVKSHVSVTEAHLRELSDPYIHARANAYRFHATALRFPRAFDMSIAAGDDKPPPRQPRNPRMQTNAPSRPLKPAAGGRERDAQIEVLGRDVTVEGVLLDESGLCTQLDLQP